MFASTRILNPMARPMTGEDARHFFHSKDAQKHTVSGPSPWTQLPAEIRQMIIKEYLLQAWHGQLVRREELFASTSDDNHVLVKRTIWTLRTCPLFRATFNLAWTSYDMAEETFSIFKLFWIEHEQYEHLDGWVMQCRHHAPGVIDMVYDVYTAPEDEAACRKQFAETCQHDSVMAALEYVSNMIRLPCHGRAYEARFVSWRSAVCVGRDVGCAKALEGLNLEYSLPECIELQEVWHAPRSDQYSKWWYRLPSAKLVGYEPHHIVDCLQPMGWSATDVENAIVDDMNFITEERRRALAKKKARKCVARPICRRTMSSSSMA